MRKQKIHKWDSNLKLFERNHLASHRIRSKAELIDSIEWAKEWTKPCKECQKILLKLNKAKGE